MAFTMVAQFSGLEVPYLFLLSHLHFSICLSPTVQEWIHFSPIQNDSSPRGTLKGTIYDIDLGKF